MSVINTNVNAIIAANAGAKNNRLLSKSMEQLSTGSRINSAADDAAGLAIASKMTAQIRGLNQAVRNANDGIAMLQVAEGAMVEVSNMLQRMRELAVQSANDTNTSEERSYLNDEFQQLKAETARIAANTQWNGTGILDGSFDSNGTDGLFKFQVGAKADQTINHTIDSLGVTTSSGTVTAATATAATTTVSEVDTLTFAGTWAEGDVITARVGDDLAQYTVTAADVAATTVAEAIATSVKTAWASEFTGITVASTGAAVTLTGGTSAFTTTAVGTAGGGFMAAVDDLTITDLATSNFSVTKLDSALTSVNESRSAIGAVVNRLTYAADNLTNVSQNTTAARSRIQDTDYAQATTELAKAQIIQQASTAMLAQANQQAQSVLSLLK